MPGEEVTLGFSLDRQPFQINEICTYCSVDTPSLVDMDSYKVVISSAGTGCEGWISFGRFLA